MIVGKHAFCDFTTIQEAIDALEQRPSDQWEKLYIMAGVYEEEVRIYRSRLHIMGLGEVEIRMNRYARELDETGVEIGTFATATLFLGGSDLIVENLIISNTAGQGEAVGQAVAVTAHSDRTIFRNCSLKAHQDTLFTGPLPPRPKERTIFGGIELKEFHQQYRHLYQNCYIEGTVDFIFGGATAYFEHCEIRSLRHDRNYAGFVTAASTPQGQEHGYVFNQCYLTGEADITPVFLGRPWREYAKTVFVDCFLDSHIDPRGWDNWDNSANEETVVYGEYGSKGPGSNSVARVGWAACEELSENHARTFRKEDIFDEHFWKQRGE